MVTSIIGGRVVMRDRKLLTMDLPETRKEVRKIATAIGEDFSSLAP